MDRADPLAFSLLKNCGLLAELVDAHDSKSCGLCSSEFDSRKGHQKSTWSNDDQLSDRIPPLIVKNRRALTTAIVLIFSRRIRNSRL